MFAHVFSVGCLHPCLYSTPPSPVYRGTFSTTARGGVCVSVCQTLLSSSPATHIRGWQDSGGTIFNLQHELFPRRRAEKRGGRGEKGERAHGRKICSITSQKYKQKSSETEDKNIKKREREKKQILFFLPALSALFPRPEFCYIQPYICSPRLRRGCFLDSSRNLPSLPSFPLPSTQLAN